MTTIGHIACVSTTYNLEDCSIVSPGIQASRTEH